MKIKEFIEFIETEDGIRVRGQLTIKNIGKKLEENGMVGIALEDIPKGSIGVITI